jgi:prepilin-type N-terminal cleavage/methylation domain-containing protein
MSGPKHWQARRGVTLIEILVVIAIIAILAALLLPVVSRAKSRAALTKCISNQKQIATALLLYAEHDPNGAFPSTNLVDDPTVSLQGGKNAITYSYRLFLGPELDAQSEIFRCPADTFQWVWIPPYGDAGKMNMVVFKRFGTSYEFNGWNFSSNTPPPWSGLAGVALASIRHPERTVLTFENPINAGFSWHDPELKPNPDITKAVPVKNVLSFVDGHAEYLKTMRPHFTGLGTNGLLLTNGVFSAPPPGFDYQWDPD